MMSLTPLRTVRERQVSCVYSLCVRACKHAHTHIDKHTNNNRTYISIHTYTHKDTNNKHTYVQT
jgi:hypothetical protein